VRVGRNKAGVARKEFPLQEQRERDRQPPVVLRKLALHSGDGVAPSGVSEMLIVVAKVMRPGAIPAIGMPGGVVIWSIWICLGAQGV
jgi:hypothetical protein